MGALDVCPFIPVRGVTMDECVRCAQAFGQRLAEELGVPGECGAQPDPPHVRSYQQRASLLDLRPRILKRADFKKRNLWGRCVMAGVCATSPTMRQTGTSRSNRRGRVRRGLTPPGGGMERLFLEDLGSAEGPKPPAPQQDDFALGR